MRAAAGEGAEPAGSADLGAGVALRQTGAFAERGAPVRRLLTWLAIALAGVVLLSAAVAGAALLLVDPNDFRSTLTERLSAASGRAVRLDGAIDLSVLPCCAVTAEALAVGNPPEVGEGDLLTAERSAFSLRLWPLLTQRQIQIGEIELQGVTLDLRSAADGSNNWTFDTLEDQPAAADDGGAAALDELQIDGLRLRDGTIHYRDAATALSLTDLTVTAGALRPEQPLPVTLAFRFVDEGNGVQAEVELETALSLAADVLTIHPLELGAVLQGDAIEARSAAVAATLAETRWPLDGDEAIPLGAMTIELRLEDPAPLTGTVDVEGRVPAPRWTPDGVLTLPDFAVDLRAPGVSAGMSGSGTWGGTEAGLTGAFDLGPGDPRKLLAALGETVETRDADRLTRLSGSGRWRLSGLDDRPALELTSMEVRLDDSTLSGTVNVEDFDRLATRLTLAIDRLDLDAYLAPTDAADAETDAAGTLAAALPVEELRALHLDGDLSVGALTVAELELTGLEARLRARDGVLVLEPLSARVYGGSYAGRLAIDARGEQARVELAQRLERVPVNALLRPYLPADRVLGTINLALDGGGLGNTLGELLEGLGGSLELDLADGAYQGMDLLYELRRARALLRQEAAPAPPAELRTPIRKLSLRGTLEDGVLGSEQLVAELPQLRLAGSGGLNLLRGELDYDLRAEVPANSEFEELANRVIPLSIKGPLARPTVRLELDELLRQTLEDTLRGRAQDFLRDKLGPAAEQAAPEAAEETAPEAEQPADEARPLDRLLERGLDELLKTRPRDAG